MWSAGDRSLYGAAVSLICMLAGSSAATIGADSTTSWSISYGCVIITNTVHCPLHHGHSQTLCQHCHEPNRNQLSCKLCPILCCCDCQNNNLSKELSLDMVTVWFHTESVGVVNVQSWCLLARWFGSAKHVSVMGRWVAASKFHGSLEIFNLHDVGMG